MNKKILHKLSSLFLLSFLLFLNGCGTSGTTGNGFLANAGTDFNVAEDGSFTLNANGSYYKDGNIINYKWFYEDDNVTIYEGPEEKTPENQVDRVAGTYTIKLIVTNNKNETAEDSVIIRIGDVPFTDEFNTEINISQFKELQVQNKVYIDIRGSGEWSNTGIIENSSLITKQKDYNNISTWLQDGSSFLNLITDKDQSFTLICALGGRAKKTASALKNEGYTNVHYLSGGINAWIAAGEPTVKAN